MKHIVLCALLALFASCVYATDYGYARIIGGTADPTIVGDVYFVTLNATFVGVYARISGITTRLDALHGMHVHEYGDVLDPTGVAAGRHYQGRGSTQHGCFPNNREEGDMGNWNVSATGTVDQYHEFDIMTLTGDYSIIGRAVIFHLSEDDCVNMTSSTTRLARGVIGVGNPSSFPLDKFPAFASPNTAINTGNLIVTNKAVCYLKGTDGNAGISGTVFFETANGGVLVTAKISGITGAHGLHVHAYGDLSLNNGTSLGDHYNPNNVAHGVPPNTPRHVGDMGSICTYDSNSDAIYAYLNTLLTITGGGVTNVLGRGVALHLNLDTGNTTSYGARIAQCVIGIANNSTVRPSTTLTTTPDVSCGVVPTPVPTTTNSPTPPSSTATSTIVSGVMLLAVSLIALVL